jgi:protein-S-isoprenylcysteine O-methyltransferase Ste14
MGTTRMNTNTREALAGLSRWLALLAIMFFGSAWSLRFWQGWVYIAIMATASVAIITYLAYYDQALLERRLNAGPVAEKEQSQQRIQAATSMVGIILMLLPGFDHRWHWSQVPPTFVILGNVCLALGFVLVFLVFRENTYSSGIVEVAKDQKVISTGPYAFVRHPMYSGVILMFLATPLALGSWWALIPAIALSAMIVVRLIDEEKFLAINLPGYVAYTSQVRSRLIPGAW